MTDGTVSNDVGNPDCSCTYEQINYYLRYSAPGVHYSKDGSMVARHVSNEFFTLDPNTKFPKPLHDGGFWRIEIVSGNTNFLCVQYRIERKKLKHLNFKWLASRKVDVNYISIGEVREVEYNDILTATLRISEELQNKIDKKNKTGKNNKSKTDDSTLQKWIGDYPPKSLSIAEKDK